MSDHCLCKISFSFVAFYLLFGTQNSLVKGANSFRLNLAPFQKKISICPNPIYKLTTLSTEKILQKLNSVRVSFGIYLSGEDLVFPKLYKISKLHKIPYKQSYMVGSAKSSPNPLSQILTRILTIVYEELKSSARPPKERCQSDVDPKKKLQKAPTKFTIRVIWLCKQHFIFLFLNSLYHNSS